MSSAPASSAPYRTDRYGGVGIRFLALVIDLLVGGLIWTAPLLEIEREPGFTQIKLAGWRFVVSLLIWLAYFVVMESTVGATVGKLVCGLRVRTAADEKKVGVGTALIRNLLRVVDAFPYLIPYLVGAIAVWTSPRRQRVGDRAAAAVVVRTAAAAPAGPPPPMPTFAHEGLLAPPPPPEAPPPPP